MAGPVSDTPRPIQAIMDQQLDVARQSMLQWMIVSLGPVYLLLIPLTGLLSLALVVLITIRGRGPMSAAALVLIIPLPILIGLFASIHGMISVHTVIAMSDTAPKPSELAAGTSTALVSSMVGILAAVPACFAAVVGATIRAITAPPE